MNGEDLDSDSGGAAAASNGGAAAKGGAAKPASMRTDWRSGMRFQQCRASLLALEDGDFSFKYWRPFFLFLCKLDSEKGTYVPQAGMINLIAQVVVGWSVG